MQPLTLVAVAAWGSFFAALASASIAWFSYRADRDRGRRAELYARMERAPTRSPQPINSADIDLRLWNDGPGIAKDIDLNIYSSLNPEAAPEPQSVEHTEIPSRLAAGDEVMVRVTVILPTDMHTLSLTWSDGSSSSRRHRYLAIPGRL